MKPLEENQQVYVKDKHKLREGYVTHKIREKSYSVKLNHASEIARNRQFLVPIPETSDTEQLKKDDFEDVVTKIENNFSDSYDSDESTMINVIKQTSSGRHIKKPDRLNLCN